jgi:hypothetical protein
MKISSTAWRAVLVLSAFGTAGCNMLTRLSEMGDAPKLTTIENPTAHPISP